MAEASSTSPLSSESEPKKYKRTASRHVRGHTADFGSTMNSATQFALDSPEDSSSSASMQMTSSRTPSTKKPNFGADEDIAQAAANGAPTVGITTRPSVKKIGHHKRSASQASTLRLSSSSRNLSSSNLVISEEEPVVPASKSRKPSVLGAIFSNIMHIPHRKGSSPEEKKPEDAEPAVVMKDALQADAQEVAEQPGLNKLIRKSKRVPSADLSSMALTALQSPANGATTKTGLE